MAIDAGDRSMEGMFHSHEYAPCGACDGEGLRDSYHSLESRLRKIAEIAELNLKNTPHTAERIAYREILALAKGETNG